jgi:hypothetical protein
MKKMFRPLALQRRKRIEILDKQKEDYSARVRKML